MNEKSFELFSKEHAQTDKIDYFVCSVAGGLFAYIGQTYTPHKFDSWFYLLMPAALLSLTVSFLFALRLIKVSRDITKINKEYVAIHESNQEIQAKLNETGKDGKPLEIFMNQLGQHATRSIMIDLLKKNAELIKFKEKESSKESHFADKLELIRNISLALGFILILSSKILQPYLGQK